MHAMPYLFIFYLFIFLGREDLGEAIAIQLTHPTHNSTHVMTPPWGAQTKYASFYADNCLDLFREVLKKYTTK